MFMPRNFITSFLFCFLLSLSFLTDYCLWARKLLICEYFFFAALSYLFDNAHFSDYSSLKIIPMEF